jgi:phage/plasmid-like protein (TIGR03299 family)
MAHEIRKNDTFGEVRKNGRKAWHGLGMEIESGLSAEEAFPLIGLDWETELLPVYAERLTMDGVERVPVKAHRMHVRKDDGLQLGMVSDKYTPFENKELARFSDALAGLDAAVTVETAGSLYGNRRVFSLIKLPEVVKATAEDVLEQYVLISNGHGGFASFSCYPTSVRVVCANTLRWSERDASRGLSFRHTGDFEEKIAQARHVLGIAQRETKLFQDKVSALVRTNMTGESLNSFMLAAYTASFGKVDPEGLTEESYAKMLARREQIIGDWKERMENERNSLAGIQGSAWSAFNAVTEYHDHERGRFKSVQESEARAHSNLFGTSSSCKMKTFKLAMELV